MDIEPSARKHGVTDFDMVHAFRNHWKVVVAMSPTRAQRAAALEVWADDVDTSDLAEIDTDELKAIAQYAERRDRLETALTDAVRAARRKGSSWSEIGAMLGVSKQAAQRKYAKLAS